MIVSGPSAMKMEEGRCGEGPSDFSPRKMSTRGSSSEVIFTYGTFKVVGSIVDRYICHVIVIEDHRDLSVRSSTGSVPVEDLASTEVEVGPQSISYDHLWVSHQTKRMYNYCLRGICIENRCVSSAPAGLKGFDPPFSHSPTPPHLSEYLFVYINHTHRLIVFQPIGKHPHTCHRWFLPRAYVPPIRMPSSLPFLPAETPSPASAPPTQPPSKLHTGHKYKYS